MNIAFIIISYYYTKARYNDIIGKEMIRNNHTFINEKIINSVSKVLRSRFLVQGKQVKNFEKELQTICKTKYALAFNSGTSALHTAMASLDLKKDDEIITTPFSFIASVNTILMCGAKPVFVDVMEGTYLINPYLIEDKISHKTKAILTVDLYGQACDYEKINKIAKKHKLKIISDSSQAIGALYKGKPLAQWADATCYSFYATKNIITAEGGALVTNNKKIYEFAKRFRQHGQDMEKPYIYHHLGYNYRMTDLVATIGLSQLPFLKKWTKKRYENAKQYQKKLRNIPGITLPYLPKFGEHVFHQYTIRITKNFPFSRNSLQQYLHKNNIQTGIYYPSLIVQPMYVQKITPYKKGMYPVAEKLSREVISLPVHPGVTHSDISLIASLIKKVYEKP